MSRFRMAGELLKPLMRGTAELIPDSKLGKLMTFGPDLAFAAASAAAAPEGTPMLDRLGIGAFDALAFGLIPSFGSRALGRAGARRLGGMTDPEKIEQVMTVSEMAGQMAPVLLGMQNPLLNNAFERAAQNDLQRQQQMQQDTQERRLEESALGSLAIGAGMAASGFGARPGAVDWSQNLMDLGLGGYI
jgi:hypothetical protein